MHTYRDFRLWLISFFSFVASYTAVAQQPEPVIRFGLVADIQYADCETAGSRYYRNSLPKLEAAIAEFNTLPLDFVVNLGDLIDRAPADYAAVLERLAKSKTRVYNTTGNHDYGGTADNAALYRMLGMPDSYYTFSRNGWKFIVLNTNEVASYANPDVVLQAELAQMQERILTEGRNNGAEWNGGISRKQMDWLRKELTRAQRKGERVIVLAHHPVYPANGLTALNDTEIVDLLVQFPAVKGYINGHHHPGAFGRVGHIPFVTTEGMIETEAENAYGVVEVFDDRIVIEGRGRTRSYTLPFEK